MHIFRIISITIVLLFLVKFPGSTAQDPAYLSFHNDEWVNSTLSGMTLDEKIGQLIMISVYPNQGESYKKKIIDQVKKFKPGGILIMQGTPHKTAELINYLQSISETPLLVATDGETGLGFRLDSTISYPCAQALGAATDMKLIYNMGLDIGKQFKNIGIHMNFAPVADVNTNSLNPVINFRSFGEDKNNVAEKSWAVSNGMQDAGIIAVAKHFPGHGDTETDSHKTLPVLNKTIEEIDSIESYPFKHLINKGIGGIMTGHLNVSSIDTTNLPASLSSNIIKKYLRETLGFNGFVVTDAMNMKGVSKPAGQADVEALKAGNDMIEFVTDLNKSVQAIKTSVNNGEINEKEINAKCKKILAVKRWLNLNEYKSANLYRLTEKLNDPEYELSQRQLIENTLTVLKNNYTLPVDGLDTLRIASVNIGGDSVSDFQKMLTKYTLIENFIIPKNASEEQLSKLLNDLKKFNLVIGGIHKIHRFPSGRYGISNSQIQAVNRIIASHKSIFVFFGNAYALKFLKEIKKSDGLILAYEDSKLTQEISAQLLFGAFDAFGKLPVTINNDFKVGFGLPLKSNGRFKYTIPEDAGINSIKLNERIDSLAKTGIDSAAFPGCQILIAKDGKIIFHKCYGYKTYKNKSPVTHSNIYDWASVTKITGPLPALMKLNSEGRFNLDAPFSKYWPDFMGSNKEDIIVRDILAHQGTLQPWIPYWHSTLKRNKKLRKRVFKKRPSSNFSFRVSSKLYMNRKYQKNMFDEIKKSPLLDKKKYVYSGLSFYLYPTIIENITGKDYESYLKSNFYKPLGAYTITYNPYKHFPLDIIIPTENDDFFRGELLQGFVHDEGASMMGGVSGNAGLFGTANDLAKLMQMYIQKGFYGGKQYIPEHTVNEFIRCQFPENDNRRGLGFDKPYIDNFKNSLAEAYPAVDASINSFGHSGYTGTFTWADPNNNLLFILFSNRVYPTRENSVMFDLNLRPAIHQAIYDCIKEGL